MNPELQKERDDFHKRGTRVRIVEAKQKEEVKKLASQPKPARQPRKKTLTWASEDFQGAVRRAPLSLRSYTSALKGPTSRFGVLTKIVKYMRQRHQSGDVHPLTLDEILDETNQLHVATKVQQWLSTQALFDNPKIEVQPDGKFAYKSVYKLKDRKALLKLLKHHDLKGLGGVMYDDVEDSLPNADRAVKTLLAQKEIIELVRPNDKKRVLFYNDHTADLPLEEEFQKLWRSVTVDALDDKQIDEYLERQGLRTMKDPCGRKPVPHKRKRPVNPRKRVVKKPRDNEHVADLLETYDDDDQPSGGDVGAS